MSRRRDFRRALDAALSDPLSRDEWNEFFPRNPQELHRFFIEQRMLVEAYNRENPLAALSSSPAGQPAPAAGGSSSAQSNPPHTNSRNNTTSNAPPTEEEKQNVSQLLKRIIGYKVVEKRLTNTLAEMRNSQRRQSNNARQTSNNANQASNNVNQAFNYANQAFNSANQAEVIPDQEESYDNDDDELVEEYGNDDDYGTLSTADDSEHQNEPEDDEGDILDGAMDNNEDEVEQEREHEEEREQEEEMEQEEEIEHEEKTEQEEERDQGEERNQEEEMEQEEEREHEENREQDEQRAQEEEHVEEREQEEERGQEQEREQDEGSQDIEAARPKPFDEDDNSTQSDSSESESEWTPQEKLKLHKALRKMSRQKKISDLNQRRETIVAMGQLLAQAVKTKVLNIDNEIENVNQQSLRDVALPLNKIEEYDWAQVARAVNTNRSAEECRDLWQLLLHPSYDSHPRNPAEDTPNNPSHSAFREWELLAQELEPEEHTSDEES